MRANIPAITATVAWLATNAPTRAIIASLSPATLARREIGTRRYATFVT